MFFVTTIIACSFVKLGNVDIEVHCRLRASYTF